MPIRSALLAGLALAAALAAPARAAPDPLAPTGRIDAPPAAASPTPPMGWNPWNAFRTDVDEAKIRSSAEALVRTGLAAKGYRFVNIDDGWVLRRLADGRLQIRTSMFPSAATAPAATGSFRPFVGYIHRLGLKAGLYTDIGRNTCAQRWDNNKSPNHPIGSVAEREVGSYGHAAADMRTIFADWGFDYIKIDACGVADYGADSPVVRDGSYRAFPPLIRRGDVPGSDPAEVERLYADLGAAIRRWGGPNAVYSICDWGEADAAAWAPRHGNLWRTSPDIEFSWASMLANMDSALDGALYAGPGHWNDPDMLAIGHAPFDAAHLTEARAHFTMWAIMAAPLLLGFDLRHAPPALLDLVGNAEVIAVDQDAAGNQGVPYRSGATLAVVKRLAAPGARAVALLNRSDRPALARVDWRQLGLAPGSTARVRDLWARRDRTPARDAIALRLPPHGAALLRVTGRPAPGSDAYLDAMPARVTVAADGLSRQTALPLGRFAARIGMTPDDAPLPPGPDGAAHGIGLFANSRLALRAEGGFGRFVATPLVRPGGGAVTFRIYADRRLVAERRIAPGAPAPALEAAIGGAKVVELVAAADAPGDGRPPMVGWVGARLLR
ncbi:NPCBM/NEW2 domain-containing protein [Sphingomonas morindae]|uniref:Alpha-galactosidase n=1 Tax=Sphingomonas morindae TaxID=1541170 RepID=A0ABY4XDF8_9SPHN|nr:NPCBM/NEW2 domain-containing protein [Sphingomonas morindae]USI74801.1 alpha-galactosidase [Sphingomonas morindae]